MRDHLLGNPALCALIADAYEPERRPQRTPVRPREDDAKRAWARWIDEAAMIALDTSLVLSKPKPEPLIKNAVYRVAFYEFGERREKYSIWLGDKWGMYATGVIGLFEHPSFILNDGRIVEVLGRA